MVSDPRESNTVSIAAGIDGYGEAPFSPSVAWPEYTFGPAALGATENPAYAGVREALRLLGLDAARFGTAGWNPLGELIRPGETVVLKPNFVRDFRESNADHGNCLITHGAIIRAVLDYAYLALDGRGRIIVADAPQNDADFAAIRRIAGLDAIQAFYRKHAAFDVEVYDLRPEVARKIDGVIVGHEPLPGDPAGYVKVNLGARSAFVDVNPLCHLLYGSEYDTREVRSHHHGEVHEYLIAKTILDADCVINLPKLKTHKKVGLTVGLKNLVGINGNKNWLPHHREGTPAQGGDQFAESGIHQRVERRLVGAFKHVFPYLGPLRRVLAGPLKRVGKRVFGDTNEGTVRSGNWHGNDTTWRMVLDLNRILLYAGADGTLRDRPVRRVLNIIDGIVAGEGNGPLDCVPQQLGAVLASLNPVAADLTCARLVGFDYRRLALLHHAFDAHSFPIVSGSPEQVHVRTDAPMGEMPLHALRAASPAFRPHAGWCGAIELDGPGQLGGGRLAESATRRYPVQSQRLDEARMQSGWARWSAYVLAHVLVSGLRAAIAIATGVCPKRKRPCGSPARVVLTGTFLADNWIKAHVLPLGASGRCEHVWVVADHPCIPIDHVTYVCPPAWLRKVFGRVASRLLLFAVTAVRHRASVVGGFHLLVNGLVALLVARATGADAIYFCVGGWAEFMHGGAYSGHPLFGRTGVADMQLQSALLAAVAQCDRVLTMGTRAKAFLAEQGIDQTVVMSGGIDERLFRSGEQPDETRFDVILVARLDPIKRVDTLLLAVDQARTILPELSVVIVGDGDLRPELEALRTQLALEDHVTFAGFQSNVRDWLRQARILALTSDSEGLPLSILEAMMAGLPVVASSVGDIADIVEDGVNGYLVPAGDVAAFADRIVELCRDDTKRVRFAKAARQAAIGRGVGAARRQWDALLASLGHPEAVDRKEPRFAASGAAGPDTADDQHGAAASSADGWFIRVGDTPRSGAPSASVLFLGDVGIGGRVGTHIERYGLTQPFANLPPDFFDADVVCFNLECCLSERGAPWEPKPILFRGKANHLDIFPRSGAAYVANVANNHFLDYGEAAALDTLAALRAANMHYFGAEEDGCSAQPVVVNTSAASVAFLGFAPSAHPLKGKSQCNVVSGSPEQLLQAVQDARRACDVLVVSLHQGLEYCPYVGPRCRTLAQRIVTAGADCVICHHTHVVQAIERYHSGIIFHGIGNFLIDVDPYQRPRGAQTLALRMTLSDGRIARVAVEPYEINTELIPSPVVGRERNALRSHVEKLSALLESRCGLMRNNAHVRSASFLSHAARVAAMIRRVGPASTVTYYRGRLADTLRSRA